MAALGALSALRPAVAEPLPAGGGDPEGKFDGQGHVLPWAGDTIICPLSPDTAAFEAIRAIAGEIERDWSAFITPTPPSSYHMTIYGGADPQRRAAGWWPKGLEPNASIADANALILDRLRAGRFRIPDPIRMRVQPDAIPDVGTVIPVQPATIEEQAMLYALRRKIAEKIGLFTPNIGTFQFHITFGYPFRPMPPDTLRLYRATVRTWRARVASRAGIVVLQPPVYCTFASMFRFDPVLTLAPFEAGADTATGR